MAVYKGKALEEQSIYGSSRLGLVNYASKTGYRSLGGKKYELSNHLGNVLAVVSDNIHLDQDSTWTSLINTTDYYPFGLAMDGRSVQDSTYRYGFQGQEKIDDIYGEGQYIDYTFRGYNPKIARFFSVDPLTAKFPYYSSYQFSGNRVIDMVELEGLEPTESGSYSGQGAIAPQRDECGGICDGTDNYRWAWNNNSWSFTSAGVTNSELTTIFPNGITESLKTLESSINLNGSAFGLNNKVGLAHFLSQAGHEVGGFSKGLGLSENLNYSVVGLTATFGKYFYSGSVVDGKYNADNFGRKKGQSANQESIANIVYANRMDNGDFASGDGYLFRGRGIFQLTGRSNYSSFNTYMENNFNNSPNFVDKPALLLENQYSIMSAMWYFQSRVLNKIEIGSATVKEVTYNVNGGYNGLSDREAIFDKANSTLK